MMKLATLVTFCFLSVTPSFAQTANNTQRAKTPELTRAEREKRAERMDKMAEVHKKMADCLRSDKPLSECRELMKKECPMAKEGRRCPMMEEMEGMGMEMHGHRHGRMKGDEENRGE